MTSTAIQHFYPSNGVLRKISESHEVLNLLTAQNSDNLSIAMSTATNHAETTQTSSERAYFILEGELLINDTVVKVWELVYIPANTPYHFWGTFKALVINSPAFKTENEKVKTTQP